MYQGKTESGFAFEIEESALDNMELVDALAESEEDLYAMPRVIQLLLGDDQKRRLYEHLRTERGNVPSGAVIEEIKQVFSACGEEGKN